ncbi:MFS transporter, partial [Francisella tularensis subsp. holarctica]|nr:MFS transporter [Francisella tularensis subsp. holarctica]
YSGLIALPLAIFFNLIIQLEKYSYSLMPKFREILKRGKQLIKNSFIWKNAIWAGLLYTTTFILTSQYGVLYFKKS